MKNYDWTRFSRKIAIKSSMSTIYDAWTKSSEIEKWFLNKATFSREESPIDSNSAIEGGDTYEWNWFLFDGLGEGIIIEANGTDFIQFSFAGDCVVDVKLSEYEDNVIVDLTQSEIPTDDESKRGIRLGCDFGWFFYMLNLKSVHEGGLDLRNKDEELKGMLNN